MPKLTMLDESAVKFDVGPPGRPSLPLTIEPRDGHNSAEFLASWVEENDAWLHQKAIEHGAVRFRGFEVESAKALENILVKMNHELSNKYRGTSPRNLQPGTEYVFSASEIPPFLPIPQHLEMSFLPQPPRWLFFCCLDAPTSRGGETSLCDFRQVYDDLSPEFKQRMYEKKLRYSRNYSRKTKRFDLDMTKLKGWEELFETNEPAAVQDDAEQDDLMLEWKGADELCLTNIAEPFQIHPDTGHKVWFAHLQVFHQKMIARDLRNAAWRAGSIFQWLLSFVLLLIAHVVFFIRGPNELGWHTMHGDGQEVSPADCHHLQETIWKNMIFDRWQLGDILMIDNFAISHGRQPFSGKRKIVVSWANPQRKANLPFEELGAKKSQ